MCSKLVLFVVVSGSRLQMMCDLPPDDVCIIVTITGSFAESVLQHRGEQSGDILSTQHSLFLHSAINLHPS